MFTVSDEKEYILAKSSTLFALEVLPKWVSLVTIYVDLCKHIELHVEIIYHILLNFLIRPRLLQSQSITQSVKADILYSI